MDNNDKENDVNIEDSSKDDNKNNNESTESSRPIGHSESSNPSGLVNPTGSVVVQQSQKPGIQESQKNSEIKNVVSEQGIKPGNEDISLSQVGEDFIKTKGPTTTTTTKTQTKTTTETGTTETTTIGSTTTTTSSESSNPKVDEMLANSQRVNNLVQSLNSLKNNSVELGINYEELVYFQRMVRPLVDTTYFLALSAQGTALTSQALNNINLAKPKQVEASIDVAYKLIKELDCVLEVLVCRLDTYLTLIENDGCNTL